jgi:hypothetical protein
LPSYLPAKEFINELLAFIKTHNRELSNLIYSREFIENPDAMRKISSKFIARVLEIILDRYDEGLVKESAASSIHTVSWPYDEVDFPYVDSDD